MRGREILLRNSPGWRGTKLKTNQPDGKELVKLFRKSWDVPPKKVFEFVCGMNVERESHLNIVTQFVVVVVVVSGLGHQITLDAISTHLW